MTVRNIPDIFILVKLFLFLGARNSPSFGKLCPCSSHETAESGVGGVEVVGGGVQGCAKHIGQLGAALGTRPNGPRNRIRAARGEAESVDSSSETIPIFGGCSGRTGRPGITRKSGQAGRKVVRVAVLVVEEGGGGHDLTEKEERVCDKRLK
jgi:hypothetical protein